MEVMNAQQVHSGPDVDRIDPSWAICRDFPRTPDEDVSDAPGFHVVCRRSVVEAIREHGRESLEVEICGVLLGNLCRAGNRLFLHIVESIRGEGASSQAAQVTFTSETWTHIHKEMEAFPELQVLGWYHTHPDFGIFLSAADLFIHANFFNLPWQVALVFDPVRDEDGMFVWRQGEPHRESYLIDERGSGLRPSDPKVRLKSTVLAVQAEANRRTQIEDRVQQLEQRCTRLTWSITMFACLLCIVVALLAQDLWDHATYGWDWIVSAFDS